MRKDAAKYHFGTGVYLLKKKGTVIYIGRSFIVLNRIGFHFDIDCDEVVIYRCSQPKSVKLERNLIKKHRPFLNVQHNPDYYKKNIASVTRVA